MANANFDSKQTGAAIAVAVAELKTLMSAVNESQVNTIPYEGSWTAPQLLTHVTKSISGMAKAMQAEAKPADRDPGERIAELKNIFLDFSTKLSSPAFIMPEAGVYEKQQTIKKLEEAFIQLEEHTDTNLDGLVEGLPFGPVTKLELLYFTLFHTQRHLHQMKRICEALKNKL